MATNKRKRTFVVNKKKDYSYSLKSKERGKQVKNFVTEGVIWDLVTTDGFMYQLEHKGCKWTFREDEIRETTDEVNLKDYKVIPIAPDYAISKDGQVIKLGEPPTKQHIITVKTCNTTTLTVILVDKKGVKKQYQVATLMLLTYKNEERKGRFVYYKDGNRLNTQLDNLSYTTKKGYFKLCGK